MERRAVLKRMFAGVLPLMVPRWVQAQLANLGSRHVSLIEAGQLRELAAVVLPASLGKSQTDGIADGFAKWIRGYKVGADLGYGYGFPHPRKAPPSPAAHYSEQLAELEVAAQSKGSAFAKLERSTQQQLVSLALEHANIQVIPLRPDGQHVATDLMSFFFHVDPDGEDFLYQVAIRRENCRSLANSGERPASLA